MGTTRSGRFASSTFAVGSRQRAHAHRCAQSASKRGKERHGEHQSQFQISCRCTRRTAGHHRPKSHCMESAGPETPRFPDDTRNEADGADGRSNKARARHVRSRPVLRNLVALSSPFRIHRRRDVGARCGLGCPREIPLRNLELVHRAHPSPVAMARAIGFEANSSGPRNRAVTSGRALVRGQSCARLVQGG